MTQFEEGQTPVVFVSFHERLECKRHTLIEGMRKEPTSAKLRLRGTRQAVVVLDRALDNMVNNQPSGRQVV